jgi:2-polyprenyl-3-methyl-5-hydroxy-6-metoxy-1,4-benzoquinol methylase
MDTKTVSQGLDPFESETTDVLLPALLKLFPKKGRFRVLDLGCGYGAVSHVIADLGHEVVGVDASENAVALARKKFPAGRFLKADIYDLPFEELENGFDIVLSTEVIEHLFYPRRLVQAARRCLKPGGLFILSTPYHGYLKNLAIAVLNRWDDHCNTLNDGWHIKFFSPATMRELLSSEGMSDISFKFCGRLPLFWKSMICRGTRT